MTFWLSVALIGLGTFLYRYSFLGGRLNLNLPASLKRALDYIPISVMAALVALGFFINEAGDISLYPPALAAGLTAVYFKRDLLTITLGLLVYSVVKKAFM